MGQLNSNEPYPDEYLVSSLANYFFAIIEKYNKNVFTTTTIAGSSLITASYTITLQCII